MTASTPDESWTVTAVTTESAWQPKLVNVSTSAWMPAPPVGSVAAKVRTMGGAAIIDAWRKTGQPYRIKILAESSLAMSDNDPKPFTTYMCLICGFIYDEVTGLPEEGIPAGTRWEDVPMNWVCPECGARKDDFELMEI